MNKNYLIVLVMTVIMSICWCSCVRAEVSCLDNPSVKLVKKSSGKWCLVDEENDAVSFKSDALEAFWYKGCAIFIDKSGKVDVVDTKGTVLCSNADEINFVIEDSVGLYVVKKADEYLLFDGKGDTLITSTYLEVIDKYENFLIGKIFISGEEKAFLFNIEKKSFVLMMASYCSISPIEGSCPAAFVVESISGTRIYSHTGKIASRHAVDSWYLYSPSRVVFSHIYESNGKKFVTEHMIWLFNNGTSSMTIHKKQRELR